jgi:transposase
MRATSILKILLALQSTRVVGVELDEDGVIVDVVPTHRIPRCGGCGRKVHGIHERRERQWRHLDLCGIMTHLRYEIRRVSCPKCGPCVESVPWAEPGSGFTLAFERHVTYLAKETSRTTVSELMRVAWRTVGRIIHRVVQRQQGDVDDRLDGLTHIGIDELSYRRHHEYVTVVIDHIRSKVVWAGEGKSADTLREFFKLLGPERSKLLEAVTIDMSGAYIKAVTEASPQALLIFDRFHVQRLAHDALDEVRREEVRQASAADKPALKKTRWALQKNPWNLDGIEQAKLTTVQQTNQRLYRAYLLKETLLAVLDRRQVNVARTKLDEWFTWAQRSKLAPFVKLARTIKKHSDGILAYVQTRLNNGRTEGINGKIRTITRRAYGFHSATSLIAMIFLCCGGIHAFPAHTVPFFPH